MTDKKREVDKPKSLMLMGTKEEFAQASDELAKFIKGHPECGPLLNELLGGFNGRKA